MIAAMPNLWGNIFFWRRATGVFAALSLALLVAAIVGHDPPEFSSMPVIAVVRDGEQRPIWVVRLARAAHQIAADSVHVQSAPAGHVYQLWLSAPYIAAPHQLKRRAKTGREALQKDRALRANVAAEVRGIKDDPIHRGYALTSVL